MFCALPPRLEGRGFTRNRMNEIGNIKLLRRVAIQEGPLALPSDIQPGNMRIKEMKEVKACFGRTMSQLPAVFGVSRPPIYTWLNGETLKEQHQGKLVQMAAAANVFSEAGFKPTAPSLERTVAQGKSFVELIGQGADGKETAERLVRIEKRGAAAREKLDALLGNRPLSRPDVADMGRRSPIHR